MRFSRGLAVAGGLEFEDGFGAGADVEFVIDMPEMPADCVFRKAQAGGDLFVGTALREQFEDVGFAGGKAFNFRRRGDRFLEG